MPTHRRESGGLCYSWYWWCKLPRLSGKASFTSSQQDDFFCQLDIKITNNGNTLEGKLYGNGNNAVLDSFSIIKANSPSVANNQAVTINKNTAKPITLTPPDPDNDPLTYSIVTQPSHVTITGGTGASRILRIQSA
jgi:hypothetical protein